MTLVEIMVAMVAGLLLMTGMVEIFLGSKDNFRLQEGLSRLQENGRYAMDVLALNLRQAGYKNDALSLDEVQFPAAAGPFGPASISFATAGQIIAGTDTNPNGTNDGILDGTDTLSFRFLGTGDAVPAPLTDCLNAVPTLSTLTVNTLYVGTARELRCRDTAGTDEPLLDGVDDMQVLYGVDTDGDTIANQYLNAATATNWGNVVGVRVALLINTVTPITDNLDNTQYSLLGTTVNAFNDGLRRHVFTATIALRNRLP